MNISEFRDYLLKNIACFGPTTYDLARRVIDSFDNEGDTWRWNELKLDAVNRVIGSLSAVLILKFERKTEEKLIAALKKIITLM